MKAQLLLVAFALSPNDAVPERRRTTDVAAYDVVIAALQLTWGQNVSARGGRRRDRHWLDD